MNAYTFSDAVYYRFDQTNLELPPKGVRWRAAHILLTKEADGISAVVLNLPGCASQGDSIEEALKNVREAIEGCVAAYRADGSPVPWRNSRGDEIPPFSEVRWVRIEEPL